MASTARFHGHLCAELAMGIRAAQLALEHLGRHRAGSELVAIVETDSCALDAIQFLTGATLGQGNLVRLDYGKVRLRPHPPLRRAGPAGEHVPGGLGAKRPRMGVRGGQEPGRHGQRGPAPALRSPAPPAGQWVLGRPLGQLYDLAEVAVEPPPLAGGYDDAHCDGCGEPTDGARLHRLHGPRLCSPCLDAALMAETPQRLRLPLCAAARTRITISSGTGSGRNRRTSRRATSTVWSASRCAADRAQPCGSSARSAAEVASPITGTGRGQGTGLP